MENPIKDLVRKFDDPDTKKDVFKFIIFLYKTKLS